MEQESFFAFIQQLEGYKVKFRELHWNTSLLSEHKLCDAIMGEITENQDKIAESCFPIFGKFETNSFNATPVFGTTVIECLENLLNDVMELKLLLDGDVNFCNVDARIDTFIESIKIWQNLTTYK